MKIQKQLSQLHLDSTLSLNKHTSPICQSVYFRMSALRLVHSALSEDTATALAVTLVQSRLDCTNFFCLKLPLPISKSSREPKTCWHRLFIVLPNLRSTPSLLLSFYWLPVISHITYKLETITYKSLPVAQLTYLQLLLQQYQPTRSFQSGNQNLLPLPALLFEFGRHAFSYCAPSVWNKLSLSIRSLNSFNS